MKTNEEAANILKEFNVIFDYNAHRPNQGNGGFAPNLVHHVGRAVLTKSRIAARQRTQAMRRKHWKQEQAPSTDLLT